MVELVDTQDLKSCALNRRAGSTPVRCTKEKEIKSFFILTWKYEILVVCLPHNKLKQQVITFFEKYLFIHSNISIIFGLDGCLINDKSAAYGR